MTNALDAVSVVAEHPRRGKMAQVALALFVAFLITTDQQLLLLTP